MSSEKVFLGLSLVPLILVTKRAIAPLFMNLLNFLAIAFGEIFAGGRMLKEESVVHITSWMALRLEERVEVPEGALNILVGGHLIETHLK